jgi:antitoxin PrlF
MESTLTSKGQATVPKAVRDHLNLGAGDTMKWFIHPDGSVLIRPVLPVQALKGMFKARRHVAIEEMDMFTPASRRRRRSNAA